eukprot:snap_masked-scaffold_9-processed-gene-9.29-mRNA-1 protein AED:0.14 eAED:0.14 QI:949/1/1/1/0.28/0.25/8/124/234
METNKDIREEEYRELKRVFKRLCNYSVKVKIEQKLENCQDEEQVKKLERDLRAIEYLQEKGNLGKKKFDLKEGKLSPVQGEVKELERKYRTKLSNGIKAIDLSAIMKTLGKFYSKADIEEIIWEVDENLDKEVDYKELKLCFERNTVDKTGLEPHRLYNLVQFMMYDKDGSGQVSLDETMKMLYARYGRDKMEDQMKILFGEDLKTQDGDGELSFEEFLSVVEMRGKGRTLKNF